MESGSRIRGGRGSRRHAFPVLHEVKRADVQSKRRQDEWRLVGKRRCGRSTVQRNISLERRPSPDNFSAPSFRVPGASVHFEPGARTAWHTHPLGQTLIVTAGVGWVQREGGPVEEIRPGDVVWFPPGEKHWHGATPTTAMTHIAIQEALNGKRSTGWRRSRTSNISSKETERCRSANSATSGLEVSALGYGCMGLTGSYGAPLAARRGRPADPRRLRARRHLLRHRRGLWPVHQRGAARRGASSPFRDEVVIATKFGFGIDPDGTRYGLDSRPEHIRAVVEATPQAAAGRQHRPALSAPRRPGRADRGRRGHGQGR